MKLMRLSKYVLIANQAVPRYLRTSTIRDALHNIIQEFEDVDWLKEDDRLQLVFSVDEGSDIHGRYCTEV